MKRSKRYSAYGRQITDNRGFLRICSDTCGSAPSALQRTVHDDRARCLRRHSGKFFGNIKPNGGGASGYIQQCRNIRQLSESDLQSHGSVPDHADNSRTLP